MISSLILGNIVRVRIVYPDGTRIQRNFFETDAIGLIFDLVELDAYDNNMELEPFQLVLSSPKCVFDQVGAISSYDLGTKKTVIK